jgi:hypothetical protein
MMFSGGRCLRWRLETPEASVGVSNGHELGPEVRIFERRNHLDDRVGTERLGVGHFQHDLRLGRLVLGYLGNKDVGTLAVAKLTRGVIGLELQIETQCLEESCRLAPVASIPSVVVMSGLLTLSGRSSSQAIGFVEVGAQRLGDQRRQGHLRFDGVVLDLPDQPDRQVHVELLDVLVTHLGDVSILVS